jgi:hypothetical protein
MLEHWPQGLQIGFPNLTISFFQPQGQYEGHKVQQIENIHSISALTPTMKPLADFNFCTNRNA